MEMILLDKFVEQWQERQYVLPGDCVLLAVSGGGDSMVMADLFLKAGISFALAHCNFGLRGESADLDERLVHEWSAANKIVFHSVQFDTKAKSVEWKKGIQETARILRYEWFELIRQQHNYAKIVTAHHANDNVETLFINLCKGTGISGIHGIQPENGNIIRPLLFATQEMLSAYRGANDIKYREDVSNLSDDYLRNAVRHNVVPVIEQLFPNAINNINESISRFGQVEILYNRAIEEERKKLVQQRGKDLYIPILKLKQRAPIETICYELLRPYGFSSGQVPHVLDLMSSESGHYISSESHRVIRNRDFLIITRRQAEQADMVLIEGVPCMVRSGKYTYSFDIIPKPEAIPTDVHEAYLDMDKIVFPIILRTWRTGDYLYPLGMKMKKKKVSRLLIDIKMPLHEKEDVRVLECSKRVAWVAGVRLDERFRIKDSTTQVLVVKRLPA